MSEELNDDKVYSYQDIVNICALEMRNAERRGAERMLKQLQGVKIAWIGDPLRPLTEREIKNIWTFWESNTLPKEVK